MNRVQLVRMIAFLGSIVVLSSISRTHAAELRQYAILPDGQYKFLTSWLGIPGGVPSPWELDFGISGHFTVEYDSTTVKLLDTDLTLTGNQSAQDDPPSLVPVTADRVQDWLESRTFVQQPASGPFDLYVDPIFPDLRLFDFRNGTVLLEGGYDSTPVDGNGMQFSVNAVFVPEPSTLIFAALAVISVAFGNGCYRPRAKRSLGPAVRSHQVATRNVLGDMPTRPGDPPRRVTRCPVSRPPGESTLNAAAAAT